jgi:hypothetical protein
MVVTVVGATVTGATAATPHAGGRPPVTGEPGLPAIAAAAGELRAAAPDAGFAAWVQPAAAATKTAPAATTRAARHLPADIEITHSEAGLPSTEDRRHSAW